jgi:hypothetical protein
MPLYSITSSACASNEGGTVNPSASAVLRLITNSNLVGCSTGRSAGLTCRSAENRCLVAHGKRRRRSGLPQRTSTPTRGELFSACENAASLPTINVRVNPPTNARRFMPSSPHLIKPGQHESRRPARSQPISVIECDSAPADGIRLLIIGSGNFGKSPLFGSLSGKLMDCPWAEAIPFRIRCLCQFRTMLGAAAGSRLQPRLLQIGHEKPWIPALPSAPGAYIVDI